MTGITNPPLEVEPVSVPDAGIVNPPLEGEAAVGRTASASFSNPTLEDRADQAVERITNPDLSLSPMASEGEVTNPVLDDPARDVELGFEQGTVRSVYGDRNLPPLEEDFPNPPGPEGNKKAGKKRAG